MIAREFQDSIPGVQDKIAKLAQILGKEYRVFNSSDNFAEIGLEFQNPRKESNMLLIQALLLEQGVQITCSPWIKSWKGSRIGVPNLAQDEAMEYIQTVFIPRLEEMYLHEKPQPVAPRNKSESSGKPRINIPNLFPSIFDNLGVIGLGLFFIYLVFFLPSNRANKVPAELESPQNQEISACFCQQAWEKVPEVTATEEQLQACTAKYICLGNAKASCLLQAERQWEKCEF